MYSQSSFSESSLPSGTLNLRSNPPTNLDSSDLNNESRLNPSTPPGRLLALDLGAKRVGVAVSDELRITTKPLACIERRSWKDLLRRVADLIEAYDARGLVIGLPLD